jgi:hypothetical protein
VIPRGFATPLVIIGIFILLIIVGSTYYLGKSSLPAPIPLPSATLVPAPSASGHSTPTILNSQETYVACGCGCCGGTEPKEQCLYHSKGDNVEKIKQEDKVVAASDVCKVAGCSHGIKYKYCD